MKWKILNHSKDQGKILDVLLENRGLKNKKEIDDFLHPVPPSKIPIKELGIEPKVIDQAIKRIKKSIEESEPIVIYGDYDVDGICSAAIMWETLRDLKAQVLPYIPLREKEGYGLSIEGLQAIMADKKYGIGEKKGLIIVVDSGIVANKAVSFANENGIDVIILDHHEIGKNEPKASVIIHTEKLCAAGISYFFSRELYANFNVAYQDSSKLELAATAAVADLISLIGPNRSIVKFGIEALNNTNRPGLRALYDVAGIKNVGTYEIGYLLAPRINASGRIESALTALRLLCTKNSDNASDYARQLNEINKERQVMLTEMTAHALSEKDTRYKIQDTKIIVIDHEEYHQGVIGLIAGKLVEKYYLPSIVISKSAKVSKASARSISGFNIIEAIRNSSALLLNAGGHPMAAGFTIETTKIEEFKIEIGKFARENISDDLLERKLKIDYEIDLSFITMEFYENLKQLEPYGIGNPEPVFSSRAEVVQCRTIGAEGKHLKMQVRSISGEENQIDAIAFGMGERLSQIKVGEKIFLAYSIALDSYNGNNKVQIKVKDFTLS